MAGKWKIYDFLSPILIMLVPFTVFLEYNEYSYAAPEVLISVAGFIALGLACGFLIASGGPVVRVLVTAGLLTLFVDLQADWIDAEYKLHTFMRILAVAIVALLLCWVLREQLSRIVTAGFAAMLVVTLVAPFASSEAPLQARTRHTDDRPDPSSRRLAPIVHIILDEQIGVEGIPVDVPQGRETRALLRSFYEAHGFRLFGRAYSRYEHTRNAIPNLLNYSSSSVDGELVTPREPHVLKSNLYFEDMANAGYDIHVYQAGYIDFCSGPMSYVSSCRTIDVTGVTALENMKLSALSKVPILLLTYAYLSDSYQGIAYLYGRLRETAALRAWGLPVWPSHPNPAAARAMEMLAALGDDVAEASAGQMFFAHLLLPHYPYIYDAECRDPDSTADWERNRNRPPLPPNNAESRSRRYPLYLGQVRCTHKKLGDLFAKWREAGVFKRLMIIVHGDHGSRISIYWPTASNIDKLSTSDYLDVYSTLFAVKGSDHGPGYDSRVTSVTELLLEATRSITGREPSGAAPPPYVFLETNRSATMVRKALPPDLWNGRLPPEPAS